jgi:hypothetical protein
MLDDRDYKKNGPTIYIIIGAVNLRDSKSSAINVAPQIATEHKVKCEGKKVDSHSPKSRHLHSIGVFSTS